MEKLKDSPSRQSSGSFHEGKMLEQSNKTKSHDGIKASRKESEAKKGGYSSLQQPSPETSPEGSPERRVSVVQSRNKKARHRMGKDNKAVAEDAVAMTDADPGPSVKDRALKSTVKQSYKGKRSSEDTRSPSLNKTTVGEVACTVSSLKQPSSSDKPGEIFLPSGTFITPNKDATKVARPEPDDSLHSSKQTDVKTLDTAFFLTTSTTPAPLHAHESLDSEEDSKTERCTSQVHQGAIRTIAQEAGVGQEARNAMRTEGNAPEKEELRGGATSLQALSAIRRYSQSESDVAGGQPTDTARKSPRDALSLHSGSATTPPLEGSSARVYLSLPSPCELEANLERRHSRRLPSTVDAALLAFCTACTLALLWALLFGKETYRGTSLVSKNRIALEVLEKFCETPSCRNAVREMTASADVLSEPCSDLRSFTCGHWCAIPIPPAATYWREQRRRYIAAVHASVLSIRRRGLFTGQPFHYMAAFYASCIGVLESRKASITDSWAAAAIDVQRWMNISDFSALLALMVEVAKDSGLTSVYKISFLDEEYVDVMTGSAIASADESGQLRRMLIEEAATELSVNESIRDKIRDIDIAVRNVIKHTPSNTRYSALSCEDFCSSKSRIWCEAFRISSIHGRVTNTNSKSALCAILNVLRAANLEALKVYLMLVPVAPFMMFEHMVRPERPRLSDGARNDICVGVLDTHVKDVFELWAKTRILSYGTNAGVSRMLTEIRQASRMTFKRFSGVVDEQAIEKSLRWADALINQSSKVYTPAVPEYGDDFIANIILLARSGALVGQDTLANIALLVANSTEADNCSRLSPGEATAEKAAVLGDYLKLLLPDVYYSDAREKLLNYGTLGVLVAMDIFDAVIPAMAVGPYEGCLAGYLNSHLGVNISQEERFSVLRTSWALETAHKAAALRHPGVVSRSLRTRLFVLRFLRTLCGEPEATARLSRLALMALPLYSLAFNCSNVPPPRC